MFEDLFRDIDRLHALAPELQALADEWYARDISDEAIERAAMSSPLEVDLLMSLGEVYASSGMTRGLREKASRPKGEPLTWNLASSLASRILAAAADGDRNAVEEGIAVAKRRGILQIGEAIADQARWAERQKTLAYERFVPRVAEIVQRSGLTAREMRSKLAGSKILPSAAASIICIFIDHLPAISEVGLAASESPMVPQDRSRDPEPTKESQASQESWTPSKELRSNITATIKKHGVLTQKEIKKKCKIAYSESSIKKATTWMVKNGELSKGKPCGFDLPD